MFHKRFFSALRGAVAAAALSAALASGAQAGPIILHGNGPSPGSDQIVPAANQGPLGGGFLEMLVTQGDPGARGGYRQQQYADPSRQRAAASNGQQINLRREVDPAYLRAEVEYSGAETGSIVVDTNSKYLYYVKAPGRAVRYGIGVGRPGFEWSGVKTISRKAEWPDWTPPSEMLARRPDLPRFMPGGPENPLGARALYLGSSLYRIHGTNEPYTIGQNVSSGCIRMMNEDVTDLYERVRVGTRVVVR